MADVTIKTATATQAILDQTIKSVVVNLDGTLTFTRWNNTTFTTANNLKGPEGPAGDLVAADLVTLKNDIGYGILAHDKVTTQQTWGFADDDYIEIAGLSVTFDKVLNRHYEINLSMVMSTGDPSGATFDVEVRDGSDLVARFGAVSSATDRVVNVGGSMIFKAGETAAATQYKVFARGNTANDITVRSDYSPARLSIVDVGTI